MLTATVHGFPLGVEEMGWQLELLARAGAGS
jgi:hypothetical protein